MWAMFIRCYFLTWSFTQTKESISTTRFQPRRTIMRIQQKSSATANSQWISFIVTQWAQYPIKQNNLQAKQQTQQSTQIWHLQMSLGYTQKEVQLIWHACTIIVHHALIKSDQMCLQNKNNCDQDGKDSWDQREELRQEQRSKTGKFRKVCIVTCKEGRNKLNVLHIHHQLQALWKLYTHLKILILWILFIKEFSRNITII